MNSKDKILTMCINALHSRKIYDDKHKERLKEEVIELNAQDEYDYFLELYNKGIKYPNDNNLLVPYLIGITDEFDINNLPRYDYGDFPDIDVDFLPLVRDYLKSEWAPKEFGVEYVANIGSYNTFGIKGSLQDMARVYGKDRGEIVGLTTQIGLKDEDGKSLTWEKALEMYPQLKSYCEENPEVADAAKRLQGRNRSMGKHAGGLIISNKAIDRFVPLVKDKDGNPSSSWVEGLHGQDLGPVGLIKFDLLVITNLMQIALACQSIKSRYGLKNICAKDGLDDWSDTSFLNDPKAIEMANNGDLRCIFQFDSDGIRRLVKEGGVDNFDDLVAYTSLYRPGPMSSGMHDMYVKRKNGEKYDIHPLLKPILGTTYGIMLFQEQVIKILHVVGDIPLKDCEIVRKAISKKKVELFMKYMQMFLRNGQKNLGWKEHQVKELWNQIEAFAGYGFNKCLTADSIIFDEFGSPHKINEYPIGHSTQIHNKEGKVGLNIVENVISNGIQNVYNLVLSNGDELKCTQGHKIYTNLGWQPLSDLQSGDWVGVPRRRVYKPTVSKAPHELICLAAFITEGNTCHPSSLYVYNNNLEYLNDFIGAAKLFGESNINLSTRSDGKRHEVRINSGHKGDHRNYNSSKILEWAKDNDLLGKKATEKKLPSWVYNIDEFSICMLLGRMWEGDGHVGKFTYYATSSEVLAKQVKELLLRIGICSNLHKKSFNYRGGFKVGYVIGLSGDNWDELFNIKLSPHLISKSKAPKLKVGAYDLIPYSFFPIIKKEIRSSGLSFGELAKKCGVSKKLFDFDHRKKSIKRSTLKSIACRIGSEALMNLVESDVKWVKIKSIEFSGSEETFDLTVNDNHNFVANGIIVHNSHGVAYTYISSKLLYLKAHYPLDFFASILSCEDASEKIKEYMIEAREHGVTVMPPHPNKSGVKFAIVDKDPDKPSQDSPIYFGFSNIKGIGESVAERIIKNQPYKDFPNFLSKFGTDLSAMKPLLGLKVFGEDPIADYKYYEHYRTHYKKRDDRRKRFESGYNKRVNELKSLFPEGFWDKDYWSNWIADEEIDFSDKFFTKLENTIHDWNASHSHDDLIALDIEDDLVDLRKKHRRAVANYENKLETDEPIDSFFEPEVIQLDPAIEKLYSNPEEVEKTFYGFLWHHPLEKCHNYQGDTFEALRSSGKEIDWPIEVRVLKCEKKTSKRGNVYQLLKVEDAHGETQYVQVWEKDWERFGEELSQNNVMVRIRVDAPSGGYQRYTFHSPPKHERWKLPKKEADNRLYVLIPKEE